jgi:hypothetical protein
MIDDTLRRSDLPAVARKTVIAAFNGGRIFARRCGAGCPSRAAPRDCRSASSVIPDGGGAIHQRNPIRYGGGHMRGEPLIPA